MDVDVAHDDRIVVVISREHKHKLLEYLLNERVRFDRDGRTPSVDPRRDETRRDATPPSDPAERPRRANDGTGRDETGPSNSKGCARHPACARVDFELDPLCYLLVHDSKKRKVLIHEPSHHIEGRGYGATQDGTTDGRTDGRQTADAGRGRRYSPRAKDAELNLSSLSPPAVFATLESNERR